MGRKKLRNQAQSTAVTTAVQAEPNPGKLAIQARYDAAQHGRRLASWNPPSSGPNRAIAGLQTIRNRSRDASRNEWAAASTIRNFVVDIVGTGITARPKTKKAALKTKLSELWEDFIKNCDADGVLDFYGQQELAARTWKEAGEVFARKRPRRLDDGLTVPLQIQLIEPELCPLFDRDLPGGSTIRQGIERNAIGKRVAYWMLREHPGDGATTVNFNELVRIPADQIFHIYKVKRPGQLRGVPDGVSSLVKLKVVGDYDDATVEKAKIQNLYAGVITRPEPTAGADNVDPVSGKVIEYAANGAPMISLEPGGMLELAPGEEIAFSNPTATPVGYGEFMRQQHLGIAGGAGQPYEIMTGDIASVSDRTLRVIIQQYRRHIEQDQWTVIIPMFCQKVRDAWADAIALAGHIALGEVPEAKDVTWAPQAWAYIHPVQDVQAKTKEIDAGLKSRSGAIAANGDDPEQIDQERAADNEREVKLGIKLPAIDPNAKKDDPKTQATVARIKAQAGLLDAQAAAAARTAEAEVDRARAYADAQAAEATRARAESDYHGARAAQATAESDVATATVNRIQAEAEAQIAEAEHRRALDAQESEARIKECQDRADAARAEADARIAAVATAEEFAVKQREKVLEAETARAEAARLDTEASRVALAELRGE